jgi:hypothetical protein
VFLDTLGDFRAVKSPSQVFYPVDGHLSGDGHAVVANAIVRRLTHGAAVGAFKECNAALARPESGRQP